MRFFRYMSILTIVLILRFVSDLLNFVSCVKPPLQTAPLEKIPVSKEHDGESSGSGDGTEGSPL